MGQATAPSAKTILIVEDEAFIRHDMADFFADAGFQVFEASDADEAIQVLAAEPSIEVVFTDVHMPGSMDGLKLAHYVRNRFPPTMLVIASGATKLTRNEMPSNSIFVAKPYDPHALLAAILGPV